MMGAIARKAAILLGDSPYAMARASRFDAHGTLYMGVLSVLDRRPCPDPVRVLQ